jgi:scyllo-inositol 2-dehydrogenase (NADP+)
MEKQPFGVGIIGFGPKTAARTFHLPLVMAEPRLKLRVVSSRLPAERVRSMLPVEVELSDNPARVIEDPGVGLVVVALPNMYHYELAKQALMAGKHVVVEKPLCITVREVDELMELAKRNQVLLSQFHNRRWDGGALTVKKMLDEGRCGKIVSYESYYDRWVPTVEPSWREEVRLGAGALYDLGIHLLDQTFALFGRPQAVTATIRVLRAGGKADDYFHLILDYGDMQAVLGASLLAASPGPRHKLSGTGGAYVKYGVDYQAIMLNDGLRPGDAGWGEDKPGMRSFTGE